VNDIRSDLTVEAITPPVRFPLQIDREVDRLVPVDVAVTGQLPPGRVLLAPPLAKPDSVVLTGPARFFSGGERVQTEQVDLSKLRKTTTRVRSLVSPHRFLTVSTEEVETTVLVAEVEARTFVNIPVIPLRDADQPEVMVYPPVADVVLSGPADSVRAVLPARIALTLSATGLPEGTHHLGVQVDKPECLSFLSIEPEQFMVIIGDVSRDDRETDQP